jgi:hypothetical protein
VILTREKFISLITKIKPRGEYPLANSIIVDNKLGFI